MGEWKQIFMNLGLGVSFTLRPL